MTKYSLTTASAASFCTGLLWLILHLFIPEPAWRQMLLSVGFVFWAQAAFIAFYWSFEGNITIAELHQAYKDKTAKLSKYPLLSGLWLNNTIIFALIIVLVIIRSRI